MSKYNDIKGLSHGDRVRLTAFAEYATPRQYSAFEKDGHTFPIEATFDNERYEGFLIDGEVVAWDTVYFEYEVIEYPVFQTCNIITLKWQCKKWNLTPTPGTQPQTLQAVLHAPDGTPMVFFICHLEAPVNVTVHDGEVNAVIHDQIPATGYEKTHDFPDDDNCPECGYNLKNHGK